MAESGIPESEFAKLERTLWENLEDTSSEMKETSSEMKETSHDLSDYTKEIVKTDKKEKNVAGTGKKRPWLTAWEKLRFRNIASIFSFENLKSIKEWSASALSKTKMTIANVGKAVTTGFEKTKSLYHKVKTSWWIKLLALFGALFLFWDKIKETLTNMWNGLDEDTKKNAKAMLDGVLDIFREVGDVIKQSVGNLFGDNGLIAALRDFVKGDVSPMLRSIFSALSEGAGGKTPEQIDYEKYKGDILKKADLAKEENQFIKQSDKFLHRVNTHSGSSSGFVSHWEYEVTKDERDSLNRNLILVNRALQDIPQAGKLIAEQFKKHDYAIKDRNDFYDALRNAAQNFYTDAAGSVETIEFKRLVEAVREARLNITNVGKDAGKLEAAFENHVKNMANTAMGELASGAAEARKAAAEEAARIAAEEATKQKTVKEISDYGKVIASFNKLDEMISGWKEGVLKLGIQINAEEIAKVINEQFSKISEYFQKEVESASQGVKESKETLKTEIEGTTKSITDCLNETTEAAKEFRRGVSAEISKVANTFIEQVENFAKSAQSAAKTLDDFILDKGDKLGGTFKEILASQKDFFREVYNVFARMTLNPTVEAESAQIEVTTQTGNQIDNSKIEDIKATINVNKADLGSLEKSIQNMNVMQKQQVEELTKQNASLTNIVSALGGFNSSAQVLQNTLAQQGNQRAVQAQNIILSSSNEGKANLYSPLALKQSQITTALAFN